MDSLTVLGVVMNDEWKNKETIEYVNERNEVSVQALGYSIEGDLYNKMLVVMNDWGNNAMCVEGVFFEFR